MPLLQSDFRLSVILVRHFFGEFSLMHTASDLTPSSSFQKAAKSIGFALITLLALAATQPEFPARVYGWILFLEEFLLTLS